MFRFIVYRLVQLIPGLLLVSCVVFAFMHVLPGDVIDALGPSARSPLSELSKRIHDARVQLLRARGDIAGERLISSPPMPWYYRSSENELEIQDWRP